MNHRWTVVEEGTGRILKKCGTSVKRDAYKAPKRGGRVVKGHPRDARAQFFDEGSEEFVDRPRLKLADSVSGEVGKAVRLSVPEGTEVYRGRVMAGVARQGSVTFTPEKAGLEALRFVPPWPYMEHVVTIETGVTLDEVRASRREARRLAARRGLGGVD